MMKTATYYIDEIKKRGEFTSDYAIAKHLLGLSKQSMTFYKKGGTFDDKACFIIAEYLDIDPLMMIAEMNVQRARSKEDSGFWKATIKKLNSSAATIFGVALVLPFFMNDLIIYIMSNSRYC